MLFPRARHRALACCGATERDQEGGIPVASAAAPVFDAWDELMGYRLVDRSCNKASLMGAQGFLASVRGDSLDRLATEIVNAVHHGFGAAHLPVSISALPPWRPEGGYGLCEELEAV